MSDQAGKMSRAQEQTTESQRRRTRYLRQRCAVVACLWMILVVFSGHWVWTLIGTFFALFLVFGIDDELQALEREQHEPIEF